MITVLLSLVLLLVLALGVIQNSVASLRASGNDRSAKAAYAIAEAGAEYARENLRTQLRGGKNLTQELTYVANGADLVNATVLSNFGSSSGAVNGTGNLALVPPTVFGSGKFQVFLTNDRNEPAASQAASVQSQTDTNNRVMLTSFGTGPTGALAVVQVQIRLFPGFMPGNMPASIVLPGPSVNFQTFSSNSREVTGVNSSGAGCFPTVATSTNAARDAVDAAIILKRPNAYQSCQQLCGLDSCGTTSALTGTATENFLTPAQNPYDPLSANQPPVNGDPKLTSVNYLKQLVKTITAVADFHSLADPGFTLGSDSDPKIVAINGDATFSGNISGAGILLVTGTLTFNGTPDYHGIILCIGDGAYVYNGNGKGTVLGATFVANINQPWSVNPAYVGVPTYIDNGGGNSKQQYDASSLMHSSGIMPLQMLTYQDLH